MTKHQQLAGALLATSILLGLAASASAMEPSAGPESPTLAQGQSYTWNAAAPGTYAYDCGIHPSMTGKITVTAGDGMGTEQPVEIRGNAFQPAEVTVPKGASVTWTNRDSTGHMITSSDAMMEKGGSMEKGMDGTTSTGSNPTPAPGALVAIGLLGLAALAVRRRR